MFVNLIFNENKFTANQNRNKKTTCPKFARLQLKKLLKTAR